MTDSDRVAAFDEHGRELVYATRAPALGRPDYKRWVVHLEELGSINFYVDDEWNARKIVEFIGAALSGAIKLKTRTHD